MKKTIGIAILMAAISVASFASSKSLGPTTEYQLVPGSVDGHYNLYYVSEAKGDVTVKFYNTKGHLIKTDKINKTNGFRKSYDLSSLNQGTYSVIISNSDGSSKSDIFHRPNEQGISLMVTQVPAKDKIKLLIGGVNEPVMVSLFDSNNRLIYEKKYNVNEGFTQDFDLRKIDSETITVKIKGKTFIKAESVMLN